MKQRKRFTPNRQSRALPLTSHSNAREAKRARGEGEGVGGYKHIPSVHTINDFHGPSSIVVFAYKDSSSGFIRDIEGVDFAETFEQGAHETEIEVLLVASDIEFSAWNAKEWEFVPPCSHLSSILPRRKGLG